MLTAKSFKFQTLIFSLVGSALLFLLPSLHPIAAQSIVEPNFGHSGLAPFETSASAGNAQVPSAANERPLSTEERLKALEQALEKQDARLDRLQKIIVAQQQTIYTLTNKLSGHQDALASLVPAASAAAAAQAPAIEDPLKEVEARKSEIKTHLSEIGAIKFSGEVRVREESFFGLSNSLANGANPVVLGNELTPRHRMRLRARLQMRGEINDEFDWGLRFVTGSFADNVSGNQTLSDFFNHKPFSLDQAFVNYKPKRAPGLRLQGGKFEPPWTFTELTIDNELMVEGFNETYTRAFKKSALKELAFVAWQLPFLERNSAFVRNANGTVNIDQSRRGGRDLALFGGQVRAKFEPSTKVVLNLSVSDLYFSGTQFISPVQVFGSQLLLPLTFTIPASGVTPAQTITTQVSIPRDLLVAGNGLGVTNLSNNATNRDGRLASGYNLVDMLARLELKHSKRWPVTVLLNFVTNTQARDVVTAGPGGADLLLKNHENHGFWGEVQVGQTKARGDTMLGYTFMRIEKDAVLTPFNLSDITQQSDMRGHRFQFAYAADPRVTFAVTGIVTERPNGLLGPFATTPPGSINRATIRLQFDTSIKF